MTKKQEEIKAVAIKMLDNHFHSGQGRPEEKSNCEACLLNGYGEKLNGEPIAPNVSGWARIYVQAQRVIPAKYFHAFQQELNSSNKLYSQALMEDCKMFGLSIEKK